jgi:hypothetical protein
MLERSITDEVEAAIKAVRPKTSDTLRQVTDLFGVRRRLRRTDRAVQRRWNG